MSASNPRVEVPPAATTRSIDGIWLRLGLLAVVAAVTIAAILGFAVVHTYDPDPRPRFTLIDQQGRRYTEQNLTGHWSLVYFGFTRCPHICPTQMGKISAALGQLEEDQPVVKPLFITVDPGNDDAETVKRYLEHFHPSFSGLTGNPVALEAAARSFGALADDAGVDGQVMHSSAIYVVSPEGRVIDYLPFESTVETIVSRLAELTP